MSGMTARAIALILAEEGFAGRPYVPPGLTSGVTLDYGYDLGWHDEKTFMQDWSSHLSREDLDALRPAIGVRGMGAKQLLFEHNLGAIVIHQDVAQAVFAADSLPEYEKETEAAMPGVTELPPNSYGALVDLVYNRGPSMDGARRVEMRLIRAAVAAYAATDLASSRHAALLAIRTQLVNMANRLWPLTDPAPAPILHKRRLDEVALIDEDLAAGP